MCDILIPDIVKHCCSMIIGEQPVPRHPVDTVPKTMFLFSSGLIKYLYRKCADVPEGLPPAKKHSLASKSTRNMTEKESKEGSGIRGSCIVLFRPLPPMPKCVCVCLSVCVKYSM